MDSSGRRRSSLGKSGKSVGRQAFQDAQFERDQERKAKLMSKAEQLENRYDTVFGVLIILNLIVMGVETDVRGGEATTQAFMYVESTFLVLFIIELALRLRAHREWLKDYGRRSETGAEVRRSESGNLRGDGKDESPQAPKRPSIGLSHMERFGESVNRFSAWLSTASIQYYVWLCFDFVLVFTSALDVWVLSQIMDDEDESARSLTSLRVLRLARVVRSIKLIRHFKDMWLLVQGLTQAVKTIFWVVFLLVVVIYICGIFLTRLVGQDPEYQELAPEATENFSSMGMSMYTLFVVLTLEEWTGICKELMSVHPNIGFFFVLYILFTHFTVMNLFVGVLVEHIQHITTTTDLEIMRDVSRKQEAIYQKLCEVFSMADDNGDGNLTVKEFKRVLDMGTAMETLRSLGIMDHEVDWLFDTLDADQSGYLSIEEFVTGVLKCKESEQSREAMDMQYRIIKEIRAAARGETYRKPGSQQRANTLAASAGSPEQHANAGAGAGAAAAGEGAAAANAGAAGRSLSKDLGSPRCVLEGSVVVVGGHQQALRSALKPEVAGITKVLQEMERSFEAGLRKLNGEVEDLRRRLDAMGAPAPTGACAANGLPSGSGSERTLISGTVDTGPTPVSRGPPSNSSPQGPGALPPIPSGSGQFGLPGQPSHAIPNAPPPSA